MDMFFFFLLLNFKHFYVSLAFLGQSVTAAALVGTQVYRPLNVRMYVCMYVAGKGLRFTQRLFHLFDLTKAIPQTLLNGAWHD